MGNPDTVPNERLRATRPLALTTVIMMAGSMLALAVAAPAVADTAPADPNVPPTVSTDALPTPQINGVIWDQVTIGNTVYAGGSFSTARPVGGGAAITRTNLLAFDVTTGLLTSFAPTLNGQVRSVAASPDGKRLYVGGDFTSVNSATRNRIAAFDTASGALSSSFTASANSAVYGVTATNSTVYFGGQFTQAKGVARSGAAAASAVNGDTLSWAPVLAGGRLFDIVVSADGAKVALGGAFTTVNGSDNPGFGLALVDASTGALLPTGVNSFVRNASSGAKTGAAVFSLNADAESFYGTGYDYSGGGTLEGAFRASWATGDLTWVEDCHGDSYSIQPIGNVVYVASHAHYCGNVGGKPQQDTWEFSRGMAFTKAVGGTITPDPYGYPDWTGKPRPTVLDWYPAFNTGSFTGQNQGPWSVTGNSDYVVYGGEFTTVNGKAQQGLVRFAVRSIAPNADGPQVSGASWTPTVDSPAAGTVRVSIPANFDRDNADLTYTVIRDGAATPVYTTTRNSRFWDRPTISWIDTSPTLAPGSVHTYRIRATDPYGNGATSATVSVTVGVAGALSSYAKDVIEDQPTSYWRLGDAAGSTTAKDSAGADTASAGPGVAFGTAGPIAGDSSTAASFSGDSSGLAASSKRVWRDNTFSVEAWFRTTTTVGGKIVGFGSSNTGESGSYDRHVYMSPSGQLNFGVYPNSLQSIRTSKSYNDGQWHYVVASLGPDGMSLYVDGQRVARNQAVTYGQSYWGYWRIGGDNSWDGNPYFQGSISDVAVYPAVLSPQKIVQHYTSSGRAVATPPSAPADAYGQAVYASDPLIYWRLGESAGSVAADSGQQGNPGNYSGDYTPAVDGAIAGTSNSAVAFRSGLAAAADPVAGPSVYSTEIWFNTTTTSGGKLTGFGSQPTGLSDSYDRHVYMQDDGRLVFGTWTGQTNTITTPSAYNDGKWHQVVATQGPEGMKLYVDGALVGSNPQTQAQSYTGYWRAGGDNTWGSSSPWFDGRLDEFSVYDTALSPETVQQHYAAGTASTPNQPPSASFTSSANKLLASFDASAMDADGSIASYAWDFGDGSTGTGPKPNHSFATGGTYTVTLTVTDDQGATASTTSTITVVPNAAPTASMTLGQSNLAVAVDGSTSSDTDGAVVGYAWDFGDGGTATGPTATHSYAAGGTYTVQLTVTDDSGASSTTTRVVTVQAANQPPTASFSFTTSGMTASFSGAGSTDPDGTIAAYAWDYGDGTAGGTGKAPTHSYAAAGTYTVTLTVTDDRGATASVAREVTVSTPAGPTTLASDTFTRTVQNGWGTADIGGPWTPNAPSAAAVTGGTGVFSQSAGTTRRATLGSVRTADAVVTAQVGTDRSATGGGAYLGVVARQVGSDYYQGRVRLLAGGSTAIQIMRGSSTTLANAALDGLTYAVGDQLLIAVQVSGTSPTTIRAKAWKVGSAEPAGWQLTTTDGTAALQTSGAVGVESYLSASATAPLTVSWDNLSATAPSAGNPTPNLAPAASFTATTSGLQANLDASASSDPDGAVTAYSWSFGDGTTGTGATVSHAYPSSGTYTAVLTVTDDKGATGTTTRSVTVTAPPADTIAADSFSRTSTTGWGTADVGGSWTTASTANYAVGGAGSLIDAGGSTRRGLLSAVSETATDSTATVWTDKLPSSGDVYVGLVGRQIGSDYYQGRIRITSGGVIAVQANRGTALLGNQATVAGVTYTSGSKLHVRVQVVSTGTTTIRVKVWMDGSAEPASWNVTATDGTAALQGAGSVGVESYLSASAANAPVTVNIDDYQVTRVQ